MLELRIQEMNAMVWLGSILVCKTHFTSRWTQLHRAARWRRLMRITLAVLNSLDYVQVQLQSAHYPNFVILWISKVTTTCLQGNTRTRAAADYWCGRWRSIVPERFVMRRPLNHPPVAQFTWSDACAILCFHNATLHVLQKLKKNTWNQRCHTDTPLFLL